MKEFHDAKGRPWQLEMNCDVIERVKEICGVNILDMADSDSNLLKEINVFPPLLAKLLFAALADQAKTKEVDEREFRKSMSGDSLSEATDALFEEIALFFPKHRRNLLQAVLKKNKELEEAGVELAMGRLADPELKRKAVEALDQQVSQRIAEALSQLAAQDSRLATGSLMSAGQPSDSSASLVQDPIPGDVSNVLPTGPGGPLAG